MVVYSFPILSREGIIQGKEWETTPNYTLHTLFSGKNTLQANNAKAPQNTKHTLPPLWHINASDSASNAVSQKDYYVNFALEVRRI